EERSAIADAYKWNLAEIYPSDDAWDAERRQLADEIPKLASRKGSLAGSPAALYEAVGDRGPIGPRVRSLAGSPAAPYEALAHRDRIGQRVQRLSVYANMRYDIDTRVGRGQQMSQQA